MNLPLLQKRCCSIRPWNVTVSLAVESPSRNFFEPVLWVDLWRDTLVRGSVEGIQLVREIYSVGPEKVMRGGKLVKIEAETREDITKAVKGAINKVRSKLHTDPKVVILPEPFLTQDFKLPISKSQVRENT